jgi:SHS2 domain-containing protein
MWQTGKVAEEGIVGYTEGVGGTCHVDKETGNQMTSEAIQEIEHTADWAMRVRGRDLRELFVNAAQGMFGLIADLETTTAGASRVKRRIELEAFDVETLLVSWLGELLWLNEESGAVFTRYEITSLTPTHLQATVCGEPAPGQWKHIKAVTFHDLEIITTDDGCEVTLVFDV